MLTLIYYYDFFFKVITDCIKQKWIELSTNGPDASNLSKKIKQ